MKATRILFPTDFSEGSHAMSVASSIARDTGAEILIVHVVVPPVAYGDGEVHLDLLRQNDQALENLLHEVVPTDKTIGYRHRLLHGDPASAIMEAAREEQVDMIVMGTHGRTGLVRLLMGSVAEAVVRRSTCPVLTCKRPTGAAAPVVVPPKAKRVSSS